ncbi:palmitoyltransferase ZDHHC4-like [Apostichopus japonicus]|uniref:palmitoyltransferase ZDHHC4-like n=1 Tax=Stichopus japonicus TaxID=307972 RepID=UPI003AB7FE18
MDFLSLMIIYSICFFLSTIICLVGSKDSDIRIIRWMFIYGEKASSFLWSSLIPRFVRQWLDSVTDRLLYRRNPAFQVIYVVLWLTVFVQFSLETDWLLRKYRIASNLSTVAYAGFFGNLVLFLCCSWTNPGIITKSGYRKLIVEYDYDNQMFKKDSRCKSCEVLKPARSKHCAICDHCVHRFDHHCTWINNCVGARNVRHFLLFLLSITLQCALVAALSTMAMWKLADVTGLLDAQYLDANQVKRPVTIFIIVQHLFMQRPFIIFITASLWLLVILTGAFTSYHIFLACTNQTTNERYKLAEMKKENRKLNMKLGKKDDKLKTREIVRFYNAGLWRNLKEVFLVR